MYRFEKPGLVSIGRLFKIEGKTEHCVETILLLINKKGFDRETAIELANVPDDCREAVFSQLNLALGC